MRSEFAVLLARGAIALGLAAWITHGLHASVVLHESFDYPDGPLVTRPSSPWTSHSGKSNEVEVVSGEINLAQSKTEDVSAQLSNGPYESTNAERHLFARFNIRFAAAPTAASGGFFAHFKDAASGFRARIWAVTNDAPAGALRLGISAGGSSATALAAKPLLPGTNYTVVIRYEMATAIGSLWVDPSSESDPAAISNDKQSAITTTSFAFRQNSGIGRLIVDRLVVATTFAEALGGVSSEPLEPVIIAQPVDQTVDEGFAATFTVGAARALSYQWKHNGAPLLSETNATLVLSRATPDEAGTYSVTVSNPSGVVESAAVKLTVRPEPVVVRTPIALLRSRVEPPDFLPGDTNAIFTAEGVVTTHVNLTSAPGVFFFMQDDTAGIAVFWAGGAAKFIPAAGDKVRVTASLGQFNGLLQLQPRAQDDRTSVKLLAAGQPLPLPQSLEFDTKQFPPLIESLEGSLVTAANVILDTTPTNFTSASNVTLTNSSGETFVLRIDARATNLIGQPKPTGFVNLTGVISQSDTSDPRTEGHQLLVTRYSDIQPSAPAPTLLFTNTVQWTRHGDAPTNTFTEHALLPGEKLTLRVVAKDPGGRAVSLFPDTAGLPATAAWSIGPTPSREALATLTYTPTTADAARLYRFRLRASNGEATNTALWVVYVPSVLEQRVTIGEFLANPTTNSASPLFNPLKRTAGGVEAHTDDEFVELVNASEVTLDFAGWTLSDSARVRHRFLEPFYVGSSNAAVIYGGPVSGAAPGLAISTIAASEGTSGLGLNNTGGDQLLLRNPAGNLVCRVVYGAVPQNASLTRFPDVNGPFVSHTTVSSSPASPGLQYNGKDYAQPAQGLAKAVRLNAALNDRGAFVLRWDAEPGRSYSVERSDEAGAGYKELGKPLETGEFLDDTPTKTSSRFYRVLTR